jgi:tetratricopeptide (TPR) repeat protein/tRNA A-37 threonylcarbamoyl transferase component Bud32
MPLFSLRKPRPPRDEADRSPPVDQDKREISLAETIAPDAAPAPVAELATARTQLRPAPADAGAREGDSSLLRTLAADAPGAAPRDPNDPASLARTLPPSDPAVIAARRAARSLAPSDAISLARTLASTGQSDEFADDRALSREELGLVRTQLGDSHDQAITDDPELARRVLEPGGDDRRLKELIRARLFRSKSAPVKIGRYTILDRLGEGGMGVVYTAYDDQLDRKIAIKVMRSEAEDGGAGKARLMREAQAMARLAHPNIVTVHEVGQVDGQVFVAMEYVRGHSLDQWLKEPRPWREVLAVFIQAGHGLEAAHRAGLVHRDFKPHNVLLADDGAVKVLDFGLARAIDSGEAPATSEALVAAPGNALRLLDVHLTRTGAIMGTPAYMSPEQHQGLPTDARSDQFSFAVALFEGLHGQHPFNCETLSGLLHDVLQGRIREPPGAAKIPAWVRKAVQRALAVDPAQRYPTITALLSELSRDPLAKRRRALATAGVAGLVGAIGFGAATFGQTSAALCQGAEAEIVSIWSKSQHEALRAAFSATGLPYAADTLTRLTPHLDAYAAAWVDMRGEACESHRSGAHSDRLYDLRVACLDQRRASLGALVDVFLKDTDADTVEKAVIAATNLPPLATCANAAALSEAVPPPEDPAIAAEVTDLRDQLTRIKALTDTGKFSKGLELVAPIRARAETLGYLPLLAEAELHEGTLEMELHQIHEAESSLSAAISLGLRSKADPIALEALSKRIFLRAAVASAPSRALSDASLAQDLLARLPLDPSASWLLHNNLGTMHDILSDFNAAELAHRQALAAAAENPWRRALTLANLGSLYLNVAHDPGRATEPLREAQGQFQTQLGPSHPYVAGINVFVGVSLTEIGDFSRARATLTQSIAVAEASYGATSPAIANFINPRGLLAIQTRDFSGAKSDCERALNITLTLDGQESSSTPLHLHCLAIAEAGLGNYLTALDLHQRAIDLFLAAENADAAEALRYQAETFLKMGDLQSALQAHQRALELREAKLPPGTPAIARSLEGVGRTLTALGRHDEAAEKLTRALAILEAALTPENPQFARVHRSLGDLALARADAARAAEHYRKAIDVYAMVRPQDDGDLNLTHLELARAQLTDPALAAADRAAARQRAEAALTILDRLGPGWAAERDAFRTWLKDQPNG